MDWQDYFTWSTIAVAGAYLLLRGRRAWRASKAGCTGGCGCSKSPRAQALPKLIAPEQLTLRSRLK